MMPRLATLLACLALALGALAVAGCGGDDNQSSGSEAQATTEQQTETTGGATAGATAGSPVEIKAVDIKFKPETATVKVGQEVKWTNEDSIAHTVTADSSAPEKFDSGTLSGGETFTFTPKKAGTYPYVCLIHPSQKGTLTVTQ
jgi:plastocyanin